MASPDQPEAMLSQTSGRQVGRYRRWLIAVVVVALLGGWLAWQFIPFPRYAQVRLPQPDETVPIEDFHAVNRVTNSRSIATVRACFTRETWLVTGVYAVEKGNVISVAHRATGRSSELSRPDDPYLMTFSVTFGLADEDTPEGRTTYIKNKGGSRSFGNFGGTYDPFAASNSQTFTGRINPDEGRLLYVEGDRQPTAASEMTVQEFAEANRKGRFLVVTIRLDRS